MVQLLGFIAEIQPELFTSLFKPSIIRDTLDSNVFPILPVFRESRFVVKKQQSTLMMFRGVCKKMKRYIENLPTLRLVLSKKGTTEVDRHFFRKFRSLSVFAAYGWDHNHWLDALVEETKHGLIIECLAISVSDHNLATLASKLHASSATGIKKVELSFYGHAHSIESSVDSFKSLSAAVGSIAININLAVDPELEMPENVYGCIETLASTASITQLSMK